MDFLEGSVHILKVVCQAYSVLLKDNTWQRYVLDQGPLTSGSRPYKPRREKTGLRGFRPGPTQTGLYKLRKELEA